MQRHGPAYQDPELSGNRTGAVCWTLKEKEWGEMKRAVGFVLIVMLWANCLSAQEFALGRVILKLKPEAAEGFLSDGKTGHADMDAYLRSMDVIRARQLAQPTKSEANKALRTSSGAGGLLAVRYGADLDPNQVSSHLRDMDGVIYAHPDYYAYLLSTPNDPFYIYQYAMTLMEMPQAWDAEQGSNQVIIGISDTGTDWDHPDLAENIWINEAEDYNGNGFFDNFSSAMGGDLDGVDTDGNGYVDDVIGWDFITAEEVADGEDGFPPDPNPMDFDGHGTNTAGIAGAVTDNDLMVAGTAWFCRIMPLKVFYGTLQGSATAIASDIVESFYYAADNGVSVLSMSWRSGDSEALRDAAAYAHSAGVFLVSSAGNESSETAPAPAAYTEVLAVAATQQQDIMASFSNRGAWIGISAPGVGIWTTAFDDTYTTGFGGTSASCPYVAGVAGLLRSLYPSMSNESVYYQLVGTADEIDGVNAEFRGDLGAGRINGYRALTEEPHPTLRLVDFTVDDTAVGNGDGLLGPGETANISFSVRNFWDPAIDVQGYLSTTDPNVVVDTSQAIIFGPVDTDSIVTSTEGASVSVSIDAEIGYLIDFNLTLDADGYAEVLPFRVPMAAQVFTDIAPALGLSPVGGSITVAFADFDLDGDVDFYRAAWSNDHGMYRNDDSTVVNVTEEWGLPMAGQGQGAAWGDYDNDGDPDLLHGTVDGLALFRNDGDGNGLADVTAEAGIFSIELKDFSPSWGDYDGDGRLDLYVAHQRQNNQLFHNNGNGTFTEVGDVAGVNSSATSYGASWADFDRDGDLDLFVANYGAEMNELFVNGGDGTFEENAFSLGLGDEANVSTCGVWGDYDGDGWLDLYVANKTPSGQPNKLFKNIRGKGFVEQIEAGVDDPRSSSGAAWGDFDGDGLLDLFVGSRQRNSLYRNLGGGRFGDATESVGIFERGNVIAWVDFDGDGDEEIYVGRSGGDQILNNLYNPGSSLHISLQGASGQWGSSLDGLGARVTLLGETLGLTRIVGEGCGLGQSSPVLTLPLAAVGADPTLFVEWPSGTIQQVEIAAPGEYAVEEARVEKDLALRAVVLPFELSHGEAAVSAEVLIQDNGTMPLSSLGVFLNVTDEQGSTVYVDSVVLQSQDTARVVFDGVPAPRPDEISTFTFVAFAAGDDAEWNDEMVQTITGGQAFEAFELPPVYWDLFSDWRWARSTPAFPAYSGQGLLLVPPGGFGEGAAVSPTYRVDNGTVMGVKFMTNYALGEDTLSIEAWQDQELLAEMVLEGSQDFWSLEILDFDVQQAGEVQFIWSCSRLDSTNDGWFFSMDDVEVVLLAGGEEAGIFPSILKVHGPWPNPSRQILTWQLDVPQKAEATVEIYDLGGRLITSNELGMIGVGPARIVLTATQLRSGAYFAKFTVGEQSLIKRFVRLK